MFPTSRTELYIEIVLFVLGRYERKQGLQNENEDLLSVYQRYESELYQVFVFLIGILVSKRKETAESVVKSLAANINFTSLKLDKDAAKYVSKRVSFALTSLSEQASLLQTLGEHLNFTQLNLRDCQIDDPRAASLSQALAANSSLSNLDLSGNRIDDSASLSKALAVNSSLTNLDLSGNHIGDSGATSLSKVLQANTSLTKLYLSGKRIGASGAASLSQTLAVNSSLTNLNLSGNDIGDSGAASLSKALAANSSLTELDLSRNSIGSSGAISLFKALVVNSSFTNLDLGNNSFDESCLLWRRFSFPSSCRLRCTVNTS